MYRKKVKTYTAVTVTLKDSAAEVVGYGSIAGATGKDSSARSTEDATVAAVTGAFSVAHADGADSVAVASGDCGWSTVQGKGAAAVATGSFGVAGAEAPHGVALSLGASGRAYGILGSWIVLAEHTPEDDIRMVKAYRVDGTQIKPNTYYTLENGVPIEVDEDDL